MRRYRPPVFPLRPDRFAGLRTAHGPNRSERCEFLGRIASLWTSVLHCILLFDFGLSIMR